MQKPNILFIAVDDLRPELKAYGADHIHSPSIDQLAAESLVFDRAYCNVPVCGASRASLLSGIRPGRHRFIDYSTRLIEDYPDVTSLPMHFKNHGYATISNGKIYHHADDDAAAWDEVWRPQSNFSPRDYLESRNIALDTMQDTRGYSYEKVDTPDSSYNDGKTALKSVLDLKKLKEKGEPFFLAVGFLKPHLPFNAPAKYWDLYDSTKISLPENYLQPESTPTEAFHNFGELRHYSGVPKNGPVSDELANKLIHGYYATVSYTDAQVGKLLSALTELGLEQNTIVILWGDHGWNLGDHMMWCKHCNFESSLHVPLMVKVPGMTSGQRSDNITEFIDIYPSLCELAGLPVPEHLDGQSFVPDMHGALRVDDFAISKFHDGVTLIQGNYFYTEYLNQEDKTAARMLFDHTDDPLELNNLAELDEYQALVQRLHDKLVANWGDDFFVDTSLRVDE
ncbi:MAG: iduronate-2-sulfatase [Cyclobacteriaceae bacterium]|nr:MAG: iduronate-2-sulfatase [Cyclobacteriaceae bacterium]